MAHYPVHLVKETSEILSSSRNLDPLNLLDGSHPCMVEVRSINDRGSLDDRDAFDDISQLDDLLDTPVNITRVRGDVDDDIPVDLHDQPHVSRAGMLRTNTQRERLGSRVRSLSGLNSR